MKIKSLCFVRSHEDNLLLCSPQNGGRVLLSDSSGMVLRLLRGEDSIEISNKLAQRFPEALCQEIENDVNEVAHELVAFGLCRVCEASAIKEDKKKSPLVQAKQGKTEQSEPASTLPQNDFAVEEFYKQYNLLSTLHLDLTNACSEKCVHCYVSHGQHDFLPCELCEKVLREFREQQGLTVQLSGGECMLHPDFAKICKICRGLDLNFIVMSNLTLCDEHIVKLLKETKPQFVNVSLYSMDGKEHDAITQVPGSWRKTRAAIDALQAAGIAIRLATPLLKANQNAYSALKQFAKDCRVHLIPDCDIIPRCGGDCSNLNYACTPEEIEHVLSRDKDFWNRGYGKIQNLNPEDKVCDIGQLLSVNSKGYYYPCPGMNEYVLGDARNVTLTEVWRGEKMNYLRGLKNKDFPQCVGCEHRAFCKVCPAFNFNATGNLFETIPAKCAVSVVKHKVYGGE